MGESSLAHRAGILCRVAVMLAFAGSVVLSAQAPDGTAQFEIASIKPTRLNRPIDSADEAAWMRIARGWSSAGRPGPRRFAEQFIPAIALIQMAYNVWGHQIQGAPAWARSARFAIDL